MVAGSTMRRWTGVVLVTAMSLAALGCAAGKFRYDRYDEEKDDVDLRDLDELLADADTAPDLAGEMKVERVEYDFAHEKDEYKLGKNDVLNIFVMGHPEMSSQRINLGEISGTTVRKDGAVYLPVLGKLDAEGLSITEFEDILRERAGELIVDPHVSVEVLQYESQKFFVLGRVGQPGAFPVDGDTTLLEGLSLAGGVPPDADLEGATVIRGGKLLPINLADILRRGDVSRNVFMKQGDVVYVPDNVAKKVYVLGEVKQPTAVAIERDTLSLAEALSTAGGPTPAKARRELAVIRGGYAKPVVYVVELEKALLYDDRIKLRPGDRIIVAPTGLATASRYMEQVLPFLRGAQAAGIAAQGATRVTDAVTNTAATEAQ